MTHEIQRWLVTNATLIFLLVPSIVRAKDDNWAWEDRNGSKQSRAELEQVLETHKLWVSSNGLRGKRADFSQANLSNANLAKAELSNANLSGANLNGANLSYSHLEKAILTGAHLMGVELYGAQANGLDLRDAHLTLADATSARLKGADFRGTELDGTDFDGADLQGAIYEPKSATEVGLIGMARNLEFLTYLTNSTELANLRKQFQDHGFRLQERKITFAMNRREAELDGPVERWFKRIAFDWTCQYGMNPGRLLKIWLVVLLVCWVTYATFIHLPGGSGIFRLHRLDEALNEHFVQEQIRPQYGSTRPPWLYPLKLVWGELRVFFWAGFFSLMSAFNIGFRDINFGRWLRLLPRTEYDLKAKGWARTVAGIQSLISVYLIALWVLTYFGHPFD